MIRVRYTSHINELHARQRERIIQYTISLHIYIKLNNSPGQISSRTIYKAESSIKLLSLVQSGQSQQCLLHLILQFSMSIYAYVKNPTSYSDKIFQNLKRGTVFWDQLFSVQSFVRNMGKIVAQLKNNSVFFLNPQKLFSLC